MALSTQAKAQILLEQYGDLVQSALRIKRAAIALQKAEKDLDNVIGHKMPREQYSQVFKEQKPTMPVLDDDNP